MLIKVTQQYLRDSERPIKEFNQIEEAKVFIQEKLENDAMLKVNVIYRIYEGVDLLEEFDQSKLIPRGTAQESNNSQSSQGAGKAASFKPTPFNVAPRPSGVPSSWVKDNDDDKDKQK